MSAITWGLSKDRRATVFCNNCRAVFAKDIELGQCQTEKAKAEATHQCTPAKPWKPGC